MICEQFLSLITCDEARNRLDIFLITNNRWQNRLSFASPFEIHSVTAGPLPGVVDVEHSLHISLAELCKKIVKTQENSVVIYARSFLKSRAYALLNAIRTITAHQDAEIDHSILLKEVQFLRKTLTISSLALTAKDCSIPEVGTCKI